MTLEKSNSRAALINEVKLDVTKQFNEQVKTLEIQLNKRNLEFKTLQESSQKTVKDLSEEIQKMNKSRSDEIEKTKKDLAEIYQKNSSVLIENEKNKNKLELQRLKQEISNLKNTKNRGTPIYVYIILLIIGLILGAILFK
ncbi:hypothetical protein ACTS9U_16720 [Empedobacter falsenii]